jgi:cholesterol transport system auxiliary component
MVYLEQDYRLDSFADHEWVDTPAAMLGPLLVKALRESGAFRTVSEDARGIAADLRLDSVIESLYQDFRTRPSQARIELRVRLVAQDGRRILATETFSDSESAPTDDAYGGVVAMNRILTRMLPRIADLAAETRFEPEAHGHLTETAR